MKLDTGYFHEKSVQKKKKLKFGYNKTKISGTLHEERSTFYIVDEMCSSTTKNRTRCFSMTTMIPRKRPIVMLHVHCLSCF